MKLSHTPSVVFDDPNLIGCAGLVPVLALAQRAGLGRLAGEHVRVPGEAGANPAAKLVSLVAGMVAGADTIDGMDLLRHGAMGRLFEAVRAPSTLGIFLRGFTLGHVRQLEAVASRFLLGLTAAAPILPGVDRVAYLDIDDTLREVHGYRKQGARYGHQRHVKGVNAQLAVLSSPLAAPVIVASRLRAGNANSIRGVGALLGDALSTATRCGAGTHGRGLVIVRADSGYYGQALVKVARRYRARFSMAARIDAAVAAAISRIPDEAWTPIKYPNAIWNETDQQWDSEAEVAEIEYTAFTNRKIGDGVTARLIVRRVKRANPAVPAGQGELFAQYRHHAIFTDSPLPMIEAEANHRDHAIIEQVIADLKDGPLAHAPSGRFAANAAWLTLATIAFNLTRAAGALASTFHAKARGATIRAQLITVPARIARSARRVRVHLPTRWPWQHAWQTLHAAATGPPPPATTH